MLRVRHFVFFFILATLVLCPLTGQAEELTLQGRVVDAETGLPLPYVNVLVDDTVRTLTNIEGDFKLQADDEAGLTFSFVGYDRREFKPKKLPKVIKLKPYTTLMQEVTVMPMTKEELIGRIIDSLKTDYQEAGKWTRRYFFRALMEENTVSFVAEAFMTAYPVVNVRSAEVTSGLQSYDKSSGKEQMNINSSNIHRLIELAPKTYATTFWKPVVKPLSALPTWEGFYKTKVETIRGEEGKDLYRITFSWRKSLLPMDYKRAHITGTAYVDAETCRLLRFDGAANNCKVRMGILSVPINIDFHLEYDYSGGVASVSNLAIHGSNDFLSYRVLLFALDDVKAERGQLEASEANIISALKAAGYDASEWSKYDIIKRTKQEEERVFGNVP